MKTKLVCFAAALAVTACASDPEVIQTTSQIAKPVTPRPNPVRSRPTTPVQTQNVTPYQGPAAGTISDFSQNAGDRVFFDYDSYTLSSSARTTLEKQAAWLNSYPQVRVLAAGNCDERGTREYNLALGARRANSVRDFLVNMGVDPSRITTISYGKERPIDPRSMGEAWSINRNTHTAIVSGAAS